MFICQISGRLSKPGEKVYKICVEKRKKLYTSRVLNEDSGQVEEVEVSHGWEIVREVNATYEGFCEWNNMSEAQRAEHLRHM